MIAIVSFMVALALTMWGWRRPQIWPGWNQIVRSARYRLAIAALVLSLSLGAITPSLSQAPLAEAPPTEQSVPPLTAEGATTEQPPAPQPILLPVPAGTEAIPVETLPPEALTGRTPLFLIPSEEPATAAEPEPDIQPETEPVLLNDRPIMEVSAAGGLTAKGRANAIGDRLNHVLKDAGKTGKAPEIEIQEDNGSPTLVIDGEQLATVTATDVPKGETAEVLAERWSETLRKQLQVAIEEKQPDFWRKRGITALGILCSALVLDFLFRWLWGQLRQWMLQQLVVLGEQDPLVPPLSEKSQSLLNFGFRAVATVLLTGWWLAALSYTADLFPATRRFSFTLRGLVVETLMAPLIPIGKGYSILQFLMLAGLLMALVILAGALTDLLKSNFLNVLGISRGVQEAIATLFKYCFITISTIVLLQLWGIDLSSLTILASALGVGIGFGFQDIAKNFGSGLVLVFERPVQVGDFVEVGGYSGTIEKLGARSTMIRTLDNLDVFVPNSRFLEQEVTNWSHGRSPSRIKLPISVAYGTDLEAVQEALLEAALGSKHVLKAPKPLVLFEGFGDSALDFVLMVWISRPQLKARIRSELNFKIDAAFRQRDIEIPFPQRDLHLRSGLPSSLPLTAPLQDENSSEDLSEPPSEPDS